MLQEIIRELILWGSDNVLEKSFLNLEKFLSKVEAALII